MLMGEDLSPRSKQILEAIIEDYIITAEPIGSRAITRRHPMLLSPATVRNVMADLEDMGFLSSPHTSAGRIPTDKAYRFYVNSILSVRDIDSEKQEEIFKRCSTAGKDLAEILKETSRMLSAASHYMGIVVAPRFDANVFRQIEFVKLGSRRLLAILVSRNGMVQNRIIESDEDIPSDDLARMSNYLNDLLEGLTIARVRSRLLREMRSEKAKYDRFMSRAIDLSTRTISEDDAEVFIEGQANILDQPEFADEIKMKEIFRTFEKKSTILQLLDRAISAKGVQIYIGSESKLDDMPGLSLITSTYVTDCNTLGVLGIIGPTRMGYSKVIPIVDYTAKLVSRLLEME